MTERTWLLRDVMIRVLRDAPLPPATWASVARRTLIVAGCFVVGLLVGDLHAGVLAAFGALQAALVEAALPVRSLIRLLVALVITSSLSVLLAMILGGTWWVVIVLGLMAYAFGALAGLAPAAMTIGVSSLALAVIFAGMPSSPAEALRNAALVTVGLVLQSGSWLVMWRAERGWFLRQALRNKLQADIGLLRTRGFDTAALVRAHEQTNAAVAAISGAGLPPDDDRRFREVLSAMVAVNRALIAWVVLEEPSEADRIAVGLQLRRTAARLRPHSRDRAATSREMTAESVPARGLRDSLAALTVAIRALNVSASPRGAVLAGPSADVTSAAPVTVSAVRASVWPGGRPSRHGLRMLVGVGVAEALTLILPIEHSFWLPLTVVFTLRPDWTFTVIRGVNRTMGNLAAVVLLPAVFVVTGAEPWRLVIPLVVLSAVTFRWFFGNYVVASFGLAGSVLVLDYALAPDESLLVIRVVAALLGAVLSMAVALAIPTWSSSDGDEQVATLGTALERWRTDLTRRLATPSAVPDSVLDAHIATARKSLLALDPTATGALLEPRRTSRAIELALFTSAATHDVAALLAVTDVAMTAPAHASAHATSVVQRARLVESDAECERALAAYRSAPDRPAAGPRPS